ncbi:hypothetical protein SLEP1_g53146 [Rubroshorea leprosula]|uniref:DUF7745 domain-containing protein n=1 Tax=Rubroshorea leprosula TaxID=152421 RepID=A0AAV5MAA1_9ROSI|nr:hypothetical protein SLEP1_g53146 [Rubroshorea leprosula]
MDFTEDTTKQGKRLGEDVTSHSTAKRAKESIFSVNTSKPDLKLLKEAYGLLSFREKHDFEIRFGCIGDLLSVVPDWDLFRAMLKFYVPEYQAFVFPQFELVPTIDEYHHFLRYSPAMDSCTFTLQAQHMKFTLEKVQEMLQAMWGFSFDFSQPLVTTREDSYGFNWNAALMALGKGLECMTSSQRINFVTLGIYGMVIFPIYVKTVAPMVIVLFEQLLHTSAFNPATVVAETLWSMKEIRAKGSDRFLGCIELFTTWAQGHLRGPQFEALFNVPVKDKKTEDWHRSLLAAIANDVRFVLPTWSATHYLASPEGHHSIPLLGIHGGSHFDYMSSSVIVNKVSEAHKMWERCRMVPIWKEKGTRSQYEQWRLSWIAKLSLPWKVTNMKNSTIMDLIAKLELSHAQRYQQVVELKDKIALLEKDFVASKEICGKQKRSLDIAKEQQRKRLLRVKANLKARERRTRSLLRG